MREYIKFNSIKTFHLPLVQRDITMSSILRIMRTHSVARVSALVDTSVGCTT